MINKKGNKSCHKTKTLVVFRTATNQINVHSLHNTVKSGVMGTGVVDTVTEPLPNRAINLHLKFNLVKKLTRAKWITKEAWHASRQKSRKKLLGKIKNFVYSELSQKFFKQLSFLIPLLRKHTHKPIFTVQTKH